MAVASNGLLFAWGSNFTGQLGDGTTLNRFNPTQVGNNPFNASSPVQVGSSSWNAVGAGQHTMAIRSDSKLFGWGYNNVGQVGNGTAVAGISSPVQIGSNNWNAVSAGQSHTVAR
jgi:alpha-tubulin suppressor-like RCC1 family protein